MALTVRLAQPRDDFEVGELLVRAFTEQYAVKLPEVVLSDGRRADLRAVAAKREVATVWVATQGERVVGTVALWAPGTPGSEAWLPNAVDLRHLAVDASVRGQRVSGTLLDAAEAKARELHASHVCLHVRQGAVGVRALYEARGYVRQPEGDLDKRPDVFLEALVLALEGASSTGRGSPARR
jgi:predicted N-acetyltransferase YhbS